MAGTLRALRVFIASPGGLDAERRAFREMLLEFNEDDAHERGVTFLPRGWELTIPGKGRPQERINEEVRRADYLLLVLWDRWGTPPSVNGKFTSGTEEEYNVARDCLASAEHPMRDIVVLFKGVEERQLSDPGEQLKKVLEFRARLEAEKTLMYGTFDSPDEFQREVRRHLQRWMRDEDSDKVPKVVSAPRLGVNDQAAELGARDLDAEEDLTALLQRAKELADDGRLAEAETVYARAVVARADVKAVTEYTRFLRKAGRLDQARATAERLIELARRLEDREGEVEGLANIGIIARTQGDFETSRQSFERAIEITEARGEDGLGDLAFLYGNLGTTLRNQGRFADAIALHERALEIRRRIGQPKDVATASNLLGVLLRRSGNLDRAEKLHREALAIFVEIDHKSGIAHSHANLGEVMFAREHFSAAAGEFEAALDINEGQGRPSEISRSLWQLGRAALAMGELAQAEERARKALEVSEAAADREGIESGLSLLGQVLLAAGELDEAEEVLATAARGYEETGHLVGRAWACLSLAKLAARRRDVAAAEDPLSKAQEIATKLGDVELSQAVLVAAAEVAAVK